MSVLAVLRSTCFARAENQDVTGLAYYVIFLTGDTHKIWYRHSTKKTLELRPVYRICKDTALASVDIYFSWQGAALVIVRTAFRLWVAHYLACCCGR
jgi:hypothetical protein